MAARPPRVGKIIVRYFSSGISCFITQSACGAFPVDVLHEGVDVCRRFRAVVNVIGVFIHIQREDRD